MLQNTQYIEDGIINAILCRQYHSTIFNRVKPDYFTPGSINWKVFRVLYRLYEEFKPDYISNQSVVAELNLLFANEKLNWRKWRDYLTIDAPFPTDIEYYLTRLVKSYNKRRLLETYNAAEKRIEKGDSTDSVTKFTKNQLDELETENFKGGPVCFHDVAADCIEKIQTYEKDSLTGIKTRFIDIDSSIIGMRPSDLIVIAGRPSMGKTTLATNVSINSAKNGYTGLMFSLEMSQYRLGLRMIASETSVNLYNLSKGIVDDYGKLVNINDNLKNLYIDFSTGLTCFDIQKRVKEFSETTKIDFIILDYLQKLRFKRGDRHDLEVAEATGIFKEIAKEYEVPFVLVSQLSRANEKAGKSVRKPRLSDLRDSGSIEQDADIVIFIHRQEVYSPNDQKHRNLADIIIAKNRDGDTGICQLTFRKQINRFENLTDG